MQIPAKSKTPKIILGIAGTISVILLGWFFLSPFWFWVSLEIIAASLVAFGCSGEWWLHHHPAGRKKKEKDEHHNLESRFIAMVSLGVIVELFALGHSIMEGKKLENDAADARQLAGQANERAAQIASTNVQLSLRIEELRHENNEFAEQQLPMSIDQKSLAMELGGLVNVRTIITNSITDPNACATAFDLAFALKNAGVEVLGEFNNPVPLPIRGIVIKFNANPTNIDDGVAESACFLFKTLVNNGLPAQFRPLNNSTDTPPGTIVVDVLQRPNPVAYKRIVLTSKLFIVETEMGMYGKELQNAMNPFGAVKNPRIFGEFTNLIMQIANLAIKPKYTNGFSPLSTQQMYIEQSNGVVLDIFLPVNVELVFNNGLVHSIILTNTEVYFRYPMVHN
jgi:hypothetical protein